MFLLVIHKCLLYFYFISPEEKEVVTHKHRLSHKENPHFHSQSLYRNPNSQELMKNICHCLKYQNEGAIPLQQD